MSSVPLSPPEGGSTTSDGLHHKCNPSSLETLDNAHLPGALSPLPPPSPSSHPEMVFDHPCKPAGAPVPAGVSCSAPPAARSLPSPHQPDWLLQHPVAPPAGQLPPVSLGSFNVSANARCVGTLPPLLHNAADDSAMISSISVAKLPLVQDPAPLPEDLTTSVVASTPSPMPSLPPAHGSGSCLLPPLLAPARRPAATHVPSPDEQQVVTGARSAPTRC